MSAWAPGSAPQPCVSGFGGCPAERPGRDLDRVGVLGDLEDRLDVVGDAVAVGDAVRSVRSGASSNAGSLTQKTQKWGLSADGDRGLRRDSCRRSGPRRRRSVARAGPRARARSRPRARAARRRAGSGPASRPAPRRARRSPPEPLGGRERRLGRRQRLGRLLCGRWAARRLLCERRRGGDERHASATTATVAAPTLPRLIGVGDKVRASLPEHTFGPCMNPREACALRSPRSTRPSATSTATSQLIAEWIERARDKGADLVVFPEQCLPGYPAEDLYLKPHFAAANVDALAALAPAGDGIAVLVGFAEPRRRRPRPAARRPGPAPGPQLAGAARRRRGRGGLPQEPAAQLRRLRRGPLLRARHRARWCSRSPASPSA